MRGMPFNPVEGKGVSVSQVYSWKSSTNISNKRKKEGGGEGLIEPRSVLDNRRSPSPPTSTSTLSSSLGGGGGSSDSAGVAAVSDSTTTTTTTKWPPSNPLDDGGGGALKKEEWAAELAPIPMGLAGGGDINDWETMLSEPAASPSQEQTFLRWIMGDFADDPSKLHHHHHHLLSQNLGDLDNSANVGFGLVDPGFGFDPIAGIGVSASTTGPLLQPLTLASAPAPAPPPLGNPIFMSPPMPPGMFFQETMEEKPQLFAPQNPAFYLPLPPFPTQQDAHHLLLPPNPKRHHSIPINPPPQVCTQAPQDLFLRRNQPPPSFPYQLQPRPMKPKSSSGDESALTHQQQQQQALVDQLLEVAELAEAGTTVSAREILARLNHQLPPSPLGKPFLRSAFYFKEALHLLLADTPQTRPPFSTPLVSPWDVVFKLSAYKAFSEVSPVLQFTNFTCTQALLEELGGADRIHIVDFDIGVGGQWSSFMQELAHRRSPAVPSLKITAFVSPCSYHPLELHLTRENLSHFATDLNIPFEFSILSIDSFDPAELLAMPNGAEATAVNLPVGSSYNPSFPALLRLVKQLNPKIVVSVDQGCDRSDLPFSHHFLQAFQSCMVLLDSIDAAGTNADAVNKIERYLVQPRIENSVLGRHRAAEKMLPWRTLFASAGFMPVQFSNFTETQAECLLKRVQVRGFHVEKRQASLFLYWQRGELVSVSAWRC